MQLLIWSSNQLPLVETKNYYAILHKNVHDLKLISENKVFFLFFQLIFEVLKQILFFWYKILIKKK